MKRMKRLSAFLLAVAMCMLLSTAVGAVKADGVSFDATVSDSLFCITGQTQTVTFGLKTSVAVAALGAKIVVPEGWTVTKIHSDLPAFDGDNYGTNSESELEIVWVDKTVDDRTLNPGEYLISIEYQIPADVEKGEYSVGLKELVLLNEIEKKLVEGTTDQYESSYNVPAVDETVTATVTVSDHDWEVTYTDTEGDTHTANYVCKNDASHTKSDEPVAHTYDQEGDKCVCGAVKPVQPAGMKGDVDLDGDVDSEDAVIIFKHAMEAAEITDETALFNADVTGEGEVDSEDAVKVFKYAMEAIDSLD